jgi:YjbE family integral membrane protein
MLLSILMIVGIDIVLGGDNAIVIAMACRNLPEELKNKAIIIGTGFAIITRIIFTLLAVYLLKIPFLQLIGGIFLIFIAIKLVIENEDNLSIHAGKSLGAAIKTIVVADLVMGLDNVVAVAGAAQGEVKLVIFGLLLSIPIMIWGSKLVLLAMERIPVIVYIGSGILAYTAGSMIAQEEKLKYFYMKYEISEMIIVLISIFFVLTFSVVASRMKPFAN